MSLPGFYAKVTCFETQAGGHCEYEDWHLFLSISVNKNVEHVFKEVAHRRAAISNAFCELCVMHFAIMQLHVETVEVMWTNGYTAAGMVPRKELAGDVRFLAAMGREEVIDAVDAKDLKVLLADHRILTINDMG